MATNNIEIWTNVTTEPTGYDASTGFEAGDYIKSSIVNASLRNATVGSFVLFEILKNNTTVDFTIGKEVSTASLQGTGENTEYSNIKSAIDEYITKTKVNNSSNSDKLGGVTSSSILDGTTGKVKKATTSESCSGNSATTTKLQTARNIGGVSFDGSANINLPGVNTTGNQDTSGKATTAGTADISKAVQVTTTAPASNNTSGVKIVMLTSKPTTLYTGWIYMIME